MPRKCATLGVAHFAPPRQLTGQLRVCVIVKFMPPEIKKSYNPFKMWGSWIGILIGLILILANRGSANTIIVIQVGFITIIFCFFVCWGIHSIFRKFSK